MKKSLSVSLACLLTGFLTSVASFALAAAAFAQVKVEEPWVRATVATQTSSGAFMTLVSERDARLVAVRTPVAGIAEIHEMALENNVMRMREVDGVPLPAGKATVLRPGGSHVMLMQLRQPLKAGERIPLTLTIEGTDGKREEMQIEALVRPLGAQGPRNGHDMGGHGAMPGH